jgi:oligoribonuclease
MDLEMTGLDPETCAIVQMAIILTDPELNEIAPAIEINIWQPESVLATMSPFVRSMHEKSGLLADVRKSEISVEDAQHTALQLISKHAPYRTARLCGNTIGQDRRFLVKYMPALEQYLHYRQVDVSSLKELAVWWKNLKFGKGNDGKHTALYDIRQSIAELKFYRENLIRP